MVTFACYGEAYRSSTSGGNPAIPAAGRRRLCRAARGRISSGLARAFPRPVRAWFAGGPRRWRWSSPPASSLRRRRRGVFRQHRRRGAAFASPSEAELRRGSLSSVKTLRLFSIAAHAGGLRFYSGRPDGYRYDWVTEGVGSGYVAVRQSERVRLFIRSSSSTTWEREATLRKEWGHARGSAALPWPVRAAHWRSLAGSPDQTLATNPVRRVQPDSALEAWLPRTGAAPCVPLDPSVSVSSALSTSAIDQSCSAPSQLPHAT
jgi:hypothetical protein